MSRPGAALPFASPVRYGSRYGSEPGDGGEPRCPVCATLLPSRRARYCSDACKQRAYRLRQGESPAADTAALAAELKRLGELVAHTLYECAECGERYLGERRCPDCNRFCRVLGLGGACPHCDQPILLAELLDAAVTR
jgi:hypothetical protein